MSLLCFVVSNDKHEKTVSSGFARITTSRSQRLFWCTRRAYRQPGSRRTRKPKTTPRAKRGYSAPGKPAWCGAGDNMFWLSSELLGLNQSKLPQPSFSPRLVIVPGTSSANVFCNAEREWPRDATGAVTTAICPKDAQVPGRAI